MEKLKGVETILDNLKPSICFIHTPCYELNDDRLEPPMGLLYLATWLQSHGYEVELCDLSSVPPDELSLRIPFADVYGFSTYTATYHRTLQILQLVKGQYSEAVTVAGGPHASALPEEVSHNFDYVIRGEGENALLMLMEALHNNRQPVSRILHEPAFVHLDDLPFPDFDLVDIHSYHRLIDGRPSVSILSSRGCPYTCTFCNSNVMHNNGTVRFRSPVNIVREIRQLKARWGVSSFRFQDDTFTLGVPRMRLITKLLKSENITFRCFGRVDSCSEEMVRLLYEAGCRHIAFGIESGSPSMLNRMQKHQSVADIRSGIANAKAAGLIVRVYLLVGFPGETWDTIKKTADLMAECQPDEFIVYPLIPYPGTPLFHDPGKYGITKINHDFSHFLQAGRDRRTGFVFQTEELDEQKIAEMRSYLIERLEPLSIWAGDSQLYR